MYEIFLTRTFAQNLKKLEKKERERIKSKLKEAAKDPWLYFERLAGHKLFKLRVGKYRVVAQVNAGEKKITLLSVAHRKKAYRKL